MDAAEITIAEIEEFPRTADALEPLARALREGAPAVRAAAARALSEVPGARAAEALARATEDEEAAVRFWAARGLQRHGDRVIEDTVLAFSAREPDAGLGATDEAATGQSWAEAAAAARAMRERLARTGRVFSDSTELIREDRER